MGQKVHPYGYRVGITKPHRSRWYASKKNFGDFLVEDFRIRKHITTAYKDAEIPYVDIERKGDDRVTVFIHTARSGMLLGKKTNRLTEIEAELAGICGKKQVDIRLVEVQRPELDAQLTAMKIADQIVRRFAFRRAAQRERDNVMGAGAKGMKICMSGRLGGAELARQEKVVVGSVPLHTLTADVDYGFAEAHTSYGKIGIKVWIHRGMIGAELPAPVRHDRGGRGMRRGGN